MSNKISQMKQTRIVFNVVNGGYSRIFNYEPLIAVGNFHMWLSVNHGVKFEYCSTVAEMEQLFEIEESENEILLTYKGSTYLLWDGQKRHYDTITVD